MMTSEYLAGCDFCKHADSFSVEVTYCIFEDPLIPMVSNISRNGSNIAGLN